MQERRISAIYYVLFTFLLIAMTFAMSDSTIQTHNQESYLEITISPGDTLWEINNAYKEQHNLSFSDFVTWVETNNGVNSNQLKPGDTLFIPIKFIEDLDILHTYASE
ncbi:LysM peptidoglycan-binding domain-containing protein [Cytobacillus suaedae]|nr:LysM peptidoglycan-binding domain-containing protein [Cytobacillus suaedae]